MLLKLPIMLLEHFPNFMPGVHTECFFGITNVLLVQKHRKLFRAGDAIRTHLYGEKSHSYGVTVKINYPDHPCLPTPVLYSWEGHVTA